jgi:hypothetical protein
VIHVEDSEQIAVIDWAALVKCPNGESVGDYLFHIPNGGKRNVREAARFKRLGVKPGVSDLFFAYPMASIHGLWIEMKKARKDFSSEHIANMSVTDNQKQWLKRMESVKYMTAVCFGSDEAIQTIKVYLGLK